MTFQALTNRPVRVDQFDLSHPDDTQHISLTEKSDLMLVAPATNTTIAKIAHGLCDDIVSLMVCAAACPVVFAPAMNSRMWDNPIAQENFAKLASLGYRFIGPEAGFLACRNVGVGRLSEPATIVAEVVSMLTQPGMLPTPLTTRLDESAEEDPDEDVA
jgi:phosphopantothenoylcysteine decarboxylase/phosphopantothenate--cysteine ligase